MEFGDKRGLTLCRTVGLSTSLGSEAQNTNQHQHGRCQQTHAADQGFFPQRQTHCREEHTGTALRTLASISSAASISKIE